MTDPRHPSLLATQHAFLAARAPAGPASVRSLTEQLAKEFGLEAERACEITIAWLARDGR